MGRTWRKRARKKFRQPSQALDHEENTINLRKFMSRCCFNDETNLKLRNFPDTGRGVATLRTLQENDVIIRVPYDLMITYTTLQSINFLHVFLPESRLTIHDLLAAFLALERHKRGSVWADYVGSLPPKPPWLPALLSSGHIELLPVDLRLASKKSRRLLQASWSRLKTSIKGNWTCECCGEKAACVMDLHSFTWGYILVNTRAVYVDPEVIRQLCDWSGVLSDEPCMALCPFLDMFNHSHKAGTRAELVYHEGRLVYQLTTLTGVKKHDQVFISYGDHDNVKLMMEYGFFIPGHCYDSVPVQSDEVFSVLEPSLNDFQYKFISNHGLDKSLYINETGASFNLKAFLFVVSDEREVKNLAAVIYNDNYSKTFLENNIVDMCHKLLECQLKKIEQVLQSFHDLGLYSGIIDFLRYRRNLIKKLCDNNKQ